MDTANPYQVHDSTVKLVILALDRDEGRLLGSVATDQCSKMERQHHWKDEAQAEVFLCP